MVQCFQTLSAVLLGEGPEQASVAATDAQAPLDAGTDAEAGQDGQVCQGGVELGDVMDEGLVIAWGGIHRTRHTQDTQRRQAWDDKTR